VGRPYRDAATNVAIRQRNRSTALSNFPRYGQTKSESSCREMAPAEHGVDGARDSRTNVVAPVLRPLVLFFTLGARDIFIGDNAYRLMLAKRQILRRQPAALPSRGDAKGSMFWDLLRQVCLHWGRREIELAPDAKTATFYSLTYLARRLVPASFQRSRSEVGAVFLLYFAPISFPTPSHNVVRLRAN